MTDPETQPTPMEHGPAAHIKRAWNRRLRRTAAAAAVLTAGAAGGAFLAAPGAVLASGTSHAANTTVATTTPPSAHRDGGPRYPGGATAPAADGKVASVDTTANTFTVTDDSGKTLTVDVSSSTTYVDPSLSSPTFADVKTGDFVAVIGTTASNTVTATKVYVSPAGDGPGGGPGWGGRGPGGAGGTPPAVAGKVASVDTTGDTFTVTDRAGKTVTVDVTSSTTYIDPSASSPTFAEVKTGDYVAVTGTTASSTVTATKVYIDTGSEHGPGGGGPGGWGGRGPGGSDGTPLAAAGKVASVGTTADTFTVTERGGGTVTVDVSATTTYVDQAVNSPTFADVKTGDWVAVVGTTASNTVTATKVFVGTASAAGPGGGGPGGPGGWGGPGPSGNGSGTGLGVN